MRARLFSVPRDRRGDMALAPAIVGGDHVVRYCCSGGATGSIGVPRAGADSKLWPRELGYADLSAHPRGAMDRHVAAIAGRRRDGVLAAAAVSGTRVGQANSANRGRAPSRSDGRPGG